MLQNKSSLLVNHFKEHYYYLLENIIIFYFYYTFCHYVSSWWNLTSFSSILGNLFDMDTARIPYRCSNIWRVIGQVICGQYCSIPAWPNLETRGATASIAFVEYTDLIIVFANYNPIITRNV
jgi:hypothetical protein